MKRWLDVSYREDDSSPSGNRWSRLSATTFGVLEAVALAAGLEDVAAVRQAVEGGAGEPLVASTSVHFSNGRLAVMMTLVSS